MQALALHLTDEILSLLLPVEKAKTPEEIRLEVDLATLIKRAWDEQVVAVLDQAIRLLRAGKGSLTPDDVTAVLTILETMLGPGMAALTQEALLRFVTSAYLLGRRKTIKTLGVAPNWAQIDDWSISVSQRHSVYWVQTYYTRELGQLVASTTEDLVFRQGLGRMDLARELQARLGNEWWAQGYQYWDVLASAVIQRTRNLANVNTLEAAGATTYEILAMMDERTCPICSRLDGKRFEVSQAVQLRDRILAAQSPEDVKTIAPWITATKENLAILDRGDPREIASRGWHLPPFHGRCRCTVVVSEFPVVVEPSKPKPVVTPQPVRREPGPWREFRSIKEATRWASERWPHIAWDFTGCALETVNPILRQFEKLAERHPVTTKRLKYIGTFQGANAPSRFEWQGEFERASGAAWREGYIGLNPAYFGNPGRLSEECGFAVKTKFHPPGCDTPESILTHEFGHHVQYEMEATDQAFTEYVSTSGFGFVRDTVRMWLERHRKPVSEYAKTNDRELWAEAFASLWHTPKSKRSAFVKRMETLLEVLDERKWHQEIKWVSDLRDEERQKVLEELNKIRGKLEL